MSAHPELSVIIVHYHTPELLRLCLRSLETNLKDLATEIFVIDSAAESDTKSFYILFFSRLISDRRSWYF